MIHTPLKLFQIAHMLFLLMGEIGDREKSD